VTLACGLYVWVGVEASGTSLGLHDPIVAMLNAASPTPLLMGLGTLLVALAARFAYLMMATYLALGYLVATVGPTLNWPGWIVAMTPFHYVHLVPAQGVNWGVTGMFVVLGVVTGALGLYVFSRKDIAS